MPLGRGLLWEPRLTSRQNSIHQLTYRQLIGGTASINVLIKKSIKFFKAHTQAIKWGIPLVTPAYLEACAVAGPEP